jgi:hypothetical protein
MTLSKENQSASHSHEHMLGHGFYNRNSHAQAKANTYALPLIVEAINRIDLGRIGSEFRIADYGSAQGQNSLLPMKTAIAQIKTLAAKSSRATTPISITHTDLPTNDWTTLFQTVLFAPDSYLVGEQDVFCFVSGTSVYQQIFPPNHIAFGYSARSLGWVSAFDSHGRTIWIVDAHGYGKRFIVRAEELLSAFLELERAIHEFAVSLVS